MKCILPALVLFLVACRQRDLTLSVDAVTREYAKSYDDAWDATKEVIGDSGMTVRSENRTDGEILAVQPDGEVVTFDLTVIDAERTKVLVHVAPGDVDCARVLHERLADELGLGAAAKSWLLWGGETLEAEYPDGLDACVQAAKRSFKACDVLLTGEIREVTRARIDGRRPDSVPCRIQMESTGGGSTKVTFIVGNERSDDSKEFVAVLKREFDTGTRP